jgi:hypothetical protein
MHYVYMLQSLSHPEQRYTGFTADLKERLEALTPAAPSTLPSTNRGSEGQMKERL